MGQDFGVGMQNFNSKNLQPSGSYHRGTAKLEYTVQAGDTLDGGIATAVNQFGSKELIGGIEANYAKNNGLNANQLTKEQKDAALLWFANLNSEQVAKDSKIENRNEIDIGDKLNLTHILNSDGTGIKGYQGGLNTHKLGFAS